MSNNLNQGASIEAELLRIGGQMANVMFNMAQRPGHELTSDDVALMDKLRQQWDAARRTPADAVGAGELPPMPEPHWAKTQSYTAEQYREGQRAAIAADRAQRKQADEPLTGSIADAIAARDAEIADLRAQLATATELATHFARDGDRLAAKLDARAAPASAQPADPEAELFDMLGRIHPLAMSERGDKEQRDGRVQRAFVRQQPWPVPDQACIVWRWDVMTMATELTQLRAYRRMTEEQEAGAQPDQRESAAEGAPGCRNCADFGWEPSINGERRPCGFCQDSANNGAEGEKNAEG
jgi:hypothetical protein